MEIDMVRVKVGWLSWWAAAKYDDEQCTTAPWFPSAYSQPWVLFRSSAVLPSTSRGCHRVTSAVGLCKSKGSLLGFHSLKWFLCFANELGSPCVDVVMTLLLRAIGRMARQVYGWVYLIHWGGLEYTAVGGSWQVCRTWIIWLRGSSFSRIHLWRPSSLAESDVLVWNQMLAQPAHIPSTCSYGRCSVFSLPASGEGFHYTAI